MKFLLVVFFSISLLFLNSTETYAKVLPQVKSSKPITKGSITSGIIVYPKLIRGKNALSVTYGNLQNAKSVSYALIYTTNGQEEAAIGSVPTSSPTYNNEVFF